MSSDMIEAGMIRQIQAATSTRELRDWKRKALDEGRADGLDEEARKRVNREYKAQLNALDVAELASQP